jgi:hypothetical protein
MNPQSGGLGLPHRSYKSLFINVVLAVALVAAVIFAVSAMSQESSTKSSTAKQVAAAVTQTQQTEDAKITAQFNDQLQQPYKKFVGPAIYGNISFNYPKTYSAYVDETQASEPVDGYFYPDVVPGLTSNTSFALRIELMTTPYSQLLDNYTSQIQAGTLTASSYIPAKMTTTSNIQAGTRLDGIISQDQQGNNQNGSMILLPVRDKTLEIYTQSTDFLGDFDKVILPSLTFAP